MSLSSFGFLWGADGTLRKFTGRLAFSTRPCARCRHCIENDESSFVETVVLSALSLRPDKFPHQTWPAHFLCASTTGSPTHPNRLGYQEEASRKSTQRRALVFVFVFVWEHQKHVRKILSPRQTARKQKPSQIKPYEQFYGHSCNSVPSTYNQLE
jgi:hypothetical protein